MVDLGGDALAGPVESMPRGVLDAGIAVNSLQECTPLATMSLPRAIVYTTGLT